LETRQIAEEGGFSKATLTGVLSTLEGRGLVTREKSATDGRLVIVQLTAKGRKMMDKLFPAFNKQERQLAASIPSDSQADFAEMLRLITKKAEATN
jgi:DNA-binding MarR family transcriptional regulator